jgi:hypothetical protein
MGYSDLGDLQRERQGAAGPSRKMPEENTGARGLPRRQSFPRPRPEVAAPTITASERELRDTSRRISNIGLLYRKKR